MIAKTKKTRVRSDDNESRIARPGGRATATRRKPTARVRHSGVVPAVASDAGSGVGSDDAVTTVAAPAETNGHAVEQVKPIRDVRGQKQKRRGGGRRTDDEGTPAASASSNGRASCLLKPDDRMRGPADGGDKVNGSDHVLAAVCLQLQQLQRRRSAAIKVKNMGLNQLAAIVSTELGYRAGLDEKERKAKRAEAEKLIKQIDKAGDGWPADTVRTNVAGLVNMTRGSREGMEDYITGLEKEMLALAKQLPVAAWVEHPDRRGVGLQSLATIIGETGDLSSYAGPAKVWKRMGCAPITSSGGETKMGSTWKMKGGLSAEEWTEAGYSPRKRAIMYVVGENIVKQNQGGPYRKRYDEAKASRPEWEKYRAHKHGMLLAVKLLLKDLWVEWRRAAF